VRDDVVHRKNSLGHAFGVDARRGLGRFGQLLRGRITLLDKGGWRRASRHEPSVVPQRRGNAASVALAEPVAVAADMTRSAWIKC